MSQVKYTYTNLRGVTRVSTFLGTQSQPSLEHQFLPFCLESNQLKGQLWTELSSFQHVTSKQNVPQECWLKITRKCLECCFKFQFWYIKQQSDKIIFQEKKSIFHFFFTSISGYFCCFKTSHATDKAHPPLLWLFEKRSSFLHKAVYETHAYGLPLNTSGYSL